MSVRGGKEVGVMDEELEKIDLAEAAETLRSRVQKAEDRGGEK